jgi:hypothetical protein
MFSTDEAEVAASPDDVELGEEGVMLEKIWDSLARLIVPESCCLRFLGTYHKRSIRIPCRQVRALEKPVSLPRPMIANTTA